MHPVLKSLISGFSFSGNLQEDVPAFLVFHACPKTATHSRSVVEKARQLAARFELDAASAETYQRIRGGDFGRVLVGLEIPQGQEPQLQAFLENLGYRYVEETHNQAYQLFL